MIFGMEPRVAMPIPPHADQSIAIARSPDASGAAQREVAQSRALAAL